MTKIIKHVDHAFNYQAFWDAVHVECRESMFDAETLGEYLDLAASTVKTQILAKSANEHWIPTIRTFVRLCNLLDLDPRDYWTTED